MLKITIIGSGSAGLRCAYYPAWEGYRVAIFEKAPIPGSEFTIEVDAVIMAWGLEADWTCLTPKCACKVDEQGAMLVNPLTHK